MSDTVELTVDGKPIRMPAESTVAAAVMMAAIPLRRAPLCGMGICFECRVTINGKPHCRSCQILCEADMDVRQEI